VKDDATVVVPCGDGNGNIVEQALNFTDCPEPWIRLHFTNGTILLPSEY
jgi:hypothetical protein